MASIPFPRRRIPLQGAAVRALALLALSALVLIAGALVPARSLASGNANFVGSWNDEPYANFKITSENLATGECMGTSIPGYTLSGCRVTGSSYEFVVSAGSYESFNTGTINGNKAEGFFHDTYGHEIHYIATREGPSMATIKGVVEDDRDLPAGGVGLIIAGTSDEKNSVLTSATSDSHGNYSIEVPAGNYTVTANGDPTEQNGGKLAVRNSPPPNSAPECPGTAKEATCTLNHIEGGESVSANFTYTYCASSERDPHGKPATGCPIIFIPGFLGSRIACPSGELWTNIPVVHFGEMLLQPNGETNAGAPGSCNSLATSIEGQGGVVDTAAGKDIYGSVLEYLNRITDRGAAPAPDQGAYAFPYDWRRSPLLAVPLLNDEVEKVLAKTGATHVVLMAHSMGGLVTQAYIANASYAEKVERAITLGTPYQGAPKSDTALLVSKSNEPDPEIFGLDLFLSSENLQLAARNMEGLYWLYPSPHYGPWLEVKSLGYPEKLLAGSEIDKLVAWLGGKPALVDEAMSGHEGYDGIKTNGVEYRIIAGSGVPTITSEEVNATEFSPSQFVRVWFGSGDGTVPLVSATEGASEGRAQPGDSVPVTYVCNVDHVGLPGSKIVQSAIEGYLLKGESLGGGTKCEYTGTETEIYYDLLAQAAFPSSTSSGAPSVKVITAAGTFSLQEAFTEGLVQLVRNGERTIVVTDSNSPATLEVSGSAVTLKVRSLTSSGKGVTANAGPASFYGPVSGAVTVGPTGAVERSGKRLKASHPKGAPHATASVSRHGRLYVVRLRTSGKVHALGIYYRLSGGALTRYRGPLKLTLAKLRGLRFSSVDAYGNWQSPQRARVPR